MYIENKMNLSSYARSEEGDMPLYKCDRSEAPKGCCDDGVCGSSWGLEGYPTGMVFAPIQHFDHIFDLDTALRKGTIFEELDLPFTCGKKAKGGCCNG